MFWGTHLAICRIWRSSYGRKILCRIRQHISNDIESNCMDFTSCIAVSPECCKGLSVAVRTCRKSISCLCQGGYTIDRREESIMMNTFANYRKNRRLMQYFFRMKNFAV